MRSEVTPQKQETFRNSRHEAGEYENLQMPSNNCLEK